MDEAFTETGQMTRTKPGEAWARITVPVSGSEHDRPVLELAAQLAERFAAELSVVLTPPDPNELAPWLGEGFMGTVPIATIDSLRQAGEDSEARASAQYKSMTYEKRSFTTLNSPVWQDLALEARLSDLVVFGDESARGRGLLSEAFTQVMMEERCGVFIARRAFDVGGTALVAWDGKEPSSRAARRALPLLIKASRVIIIGAPVGDAPADLERLGRYYGAHGVEATYERLPKGEIYAQLVEANERLGADYMVAGAFGHSRIREFAFGGTTRQLLQNSGLNLYMAH
ncbi:MAG: universal stress protein [Asticcacaulis sp.]